MLTSGRPRVSLVCCCERGLIAVNQSTNHLSGNLRANLHMRVGADATDQNSLAAQAYRIRRRPLRIAALSLLGGPALLRMLPYGRQLRLGGAFAMLGLAE